MVISNECCNDINFEQSQNSLSQAKETGLKILPTICACPVEYMKNRKQWELNSRIGVHSNEIDKELHFLFDSNWTWVHNQPIDNSILEKKVWIVDNMQCVSIDKGFAVGEMSAGNIDFNKWLLFLYEDLNDPNQSNRQEELYLPQTIKLLHQVAKNGDCEQGYDIILEYLGEVKLNIFLSIVQQRLVFHY